MSKSMIKRMFKPKAVKSKLKEQDWRFIKARYHRSNRAEKTKLLNELSDLLWLQPSIFAASAKQSHWQKICQEMPQS